MPPSNKPKPPRFTQDELNAINEALLDDPDTADLAERVIDALSEGGSSPPPDKTNP